MLDPIFEESRQRISELVDNNYGTIKNLDKNLLREALNFLTQKYKETGSLMRSLNLTMYVADKHGAKGRLLNKTLEKHFR